MRISDWSSDVCSSDLLEHRGADQRVLQSLRSHRRWPVGQRAAARGLRNLHARWRRIRSLQYLGRVGHAAADLGRQGAQCRLQIGALPWPLSSEEHTSELQSLMRITYAVYGSQTKRLNISKK